ncbi:phosphoserine phosphatase SerB [Thalassotalea piscium]|uniref:Phosphoserine phosphatase n=1 Tax=Thalassotalea piscium TaxID=1230533 RepID=A0A7X0TV36_9GAMM|nr:phosphoserine phosphatase SerB [Thalassotalea piscium]MBB6544843.1 phosphoserine phosphatase [Thalassotalea piscium]
MSVLQFSLNTINGQQLQDVISPSSNINLLPLAFSFTDNELSLSSAKPASSKVELVVMGDILVSILHTIFRQCLLNSPTLTAINFRNQLHSYRFTVDCDDLELARHALANLALDNAFEAAIINAAPKLSLPGLLVMDMDSTTIKIECIDEIAVLAGVGEQVAAVTELAMQGELDFAQSLHQRVATLANAPESIIAEVAKSLPLMEGLETLISALKQHNWRVGIASGGFTYFADHLQQLLALDDVSANVLEINNGLLTGKVLGKVIDAQAKADYLNALQQKYQLNPSQTVAMGDGANDLIMMNAASLGVAFHAKPIVLKQADCSINYHGLDYLLHWLA